MGGNKKYIEMFGSFMEPFNCILYCRQPAPPLVIHVPTQPCGLSGAGMVTPVGLVRVKVTNIFFFFSWKFLMCL